MNSAVVTSKPIFIVGMNGSGTTMLLNSLDSHPDIYGFSRETKIIPYFIQSAGKFGDLTIDKNFRRMWDAFLGVSFFKYVNNGKSVPIPEYWQNVPRSAAGVIDGTLKYFAQKEGKSRWCEKTPMHAQHIPLLARNFPNAKFIHIIRDGRACAASFHRRWGFTPELTVYRWKHIVQEARRQGDRLPGRYYELHYEDLTNNPEIWLKDICRFLQVPYNPRILALSHVRQYSGSSDAVITRRKEYWRDYFSAEKIDALDCLAGKTLYSIGYKTKHPESDKEPGILRVKYWMYNDNFKHGVKILRNELAYRRSGGKWDDLSGKLLNSIRQRLTNRL
jgi:hypothetical protein